MLGVDLFDLVTTSTTLGQSLADTKPLQHSTKMPGPSRV